MKAILIILMVVLAVYVGVSAMLLERTRKQAIQEMDEMSKLYTDELDNRFLADQPEPVFQYHGEESGVFCIGGLY